MEKTFLAFFICTGISQILLLPFSLTVNAFVVAVKRVTLVTWLYRQIALARRNDQGRTCLSFKTSDEYGLLRPYITIVVFYINLHFIYKLLPFPCLDCRDL